MVISWSYQPRCASDIYIYISPQKNQEKVFLTVSLPSTIPTLSLEPEVVMEEISDDDI